jgi:hypothetical protein
MADAYEESNKQKELSSRIRNAEEEFKIRWIVKSSTS